MRKRVRQFVSALTAKITPADALFVRSLLDVREQALFFGMDKADQRHSIDVSETCLKILQAGNRQVNRQLLLKAALLHDVGKQAGNLKLHDRISVVLLRRFMPALFFRLAEEHGTPFHISLYHPDIGMNLCRRAGCPQDLLNLIARHQTGGPGVELEILMQADQLN